MKGALYSRFSDFFLKSKGTLILRVMLFFFVAILVVGCGIDLGPTKTECWYRKDDHHYRHLAAGKYKHQMRGRSTLIRIPEVRVHRDHLRLSVMALRQGAHEPMRHLARLDRHPHPTKGGAA